MRLSTPKFISFNSNNTYIISRESTTTNYSNLNNITLPIQQTQNLNYKIVLIGDISVGKTSISYRIKTGEFNAVSQPTLGFDYLSFYLKYKNKILKLEVWDTCGQEAYRSLIKSFFSNSSLAIIVYAIDDLNSFDSIEQWVRQCKNECGPETKFFLIGNKADLDGDK